jgi:serine/threonine-protein kinase RsbT
MSSAAMTVLKTERLPIRSDSDIVKMRQQVRAWAIEAALSLVDQTKLVTAASELGRNTRIYGGGGDVTLEMLENGFRRGVRLAFVDHGPGIADVELALKDGYTSGGGLGLGLGGAKRLSNQFEIITAPGQGTSVIITRWKS